MPPVHGFITTAEPPVGWYPSFCESAIPCSTAASVARWSCALMVSWSVGSALGAGTVSGPAMRPCESTRSRARRKPGLSSES